MEKKYIYIKKGMGFVEFDTPISQELNGNDLGSTWQDYLDDKWVLLNDEQIAWKDNHQHASVKEVFDMAMTPAKIRTLVEAKREMIRRIEQFDKSDAVNAFTVNGEIKDWFTPDKRSNYRNSIDAAKIVGLENLSLFVGGMSITIPTQTAELLLAQIQLYADACYIVTQQHKAAVEALTTVEQVDGYDYFIGYPEKLNFELPNVEEQ